MSLAKKPVNKYPQGNYEIILLKQRKNLFEKGEGVSIVKERKKRGTRICSRKIEGGIYLTLKITANCIYVFVGKKDGKKHMVQDYRYLNE